MEDQKYSITSIATATARLVHLLLDEDPKIFRDMEATYFMDSEGAKRRRSTWELQNKPILMHLRALFLVRHRFAEDELARFAASGTEQFLLLGAGMDTFFLRCPDSLRHLKIFELDHPATQNWKQNRLAELGVKIPDNTTFVPVNFERQTIREALADTGFNFEKKTFISWLGVIYYLTEETIQNTLSEISRIFPEGSAISFDFCLKEDLLNEQGKAELQFTKKFAAEWGEPFLSLFNPEELVEKLKGWGFSQPELVDGEELRSRYFAGRTDDLDLMDYCALMTARVGPK